MPSINSMLRRAKSLAKQGEIQQAGQIYLSILERFPKNVQARKGLRFLKSVEVSAKTHNINELAQQAFSFYLKEELDKAENMFQDILRINPNHIEALQLLGVIAYQKEHYQKSVDFIGRAIKLDPNNAEFHANMGSSLAALKQFEMAVHCFDKAISLKNNFSDAYYNRGLSLSQLNQQEAAIASYDKAISIRPDYVEAYYNRGIALAERNQSEPAISSYKQAINLNPTFPGAHCNLGTELIKLKQLNEAIISLDRAISLNPMLYEAYLARSQALFALNNYKQGWKDYEYRWRSPSHTSKQLKTKHPMWQPESEKTRLLVWAEQGIGDEIMFSALLPNMAKFVDKVLVQSDLRLIPLLKRSMPDLDFYPRSKIVDDTLYDAHLPMASMGQYCLGELNDFSKISPGYLIADSDRTNKIKQSFNTIEKFTIGVSWQTTGRAGRHRNLPLKDFVALFKDIDVELINLQYGEVEADITEFSQQGIKVYQCDNVDNFNDIDGLSSLIDACDLVVSIDNATVHLSGALGKPTWILLPYIAESRWLIDRDDSPWYPSAKLFRQQSLDDWGFALENLRSELEKIRGF